MTFLWLVRAHGVSRTLLGLYAGICLILLVIVATQILSQAMEPSMLRGDVSDLIFTPVGITLCVCIWMLPLVFMPGQAYLLFGLLVPPGAAPLGMAVLTASRPVLTPLFIIAPAFAASVLLGTIFAVVPGLVLILIGSVAVPMVLYRPQPLRQSLLSTRMLLRGYWLAYSIYLLSIALGGAFIVTLLLLTAQSLNLLPLVCLVLIPWWCFFLQAAAVAGLLRLKECRR